jgi:hypothetical protein
MIIVKLINLKDAKREWMMMTIGKK